ncbi:hypothetical protein O9K51_05776 [Purpureocillium lavendulum]|uniref:Uncharacterized protein n=1 Tax=Purpureocillium lavendulum TaxID=1247861 RepID=A0AB34FT06_9HYPO|nr:hypothetical protein O9K51_05776 [Purpureocillium lavendulum]
MAPDSDSTGASRDQPRVACFVGGQQSPSGGNSGGSHGDGGGCGWQASKRRVGIRRGRRDGAGPDERAETALQMSRLVRNDVGRGRRKRGRNAREPRGPGAQ